MTNNNKFFIEAGGVVLYEPMTILTNVIMALICFFFVYKLKDASSTGNSWKNYFGYMGVSTFLGAIVHGFDYYISDYILFNLWLIMQVIIASSIYFAEIATARYFSNQHQFEKLKYLFLIKLAVTAILIFLAHNFLVVVVNVALGLIPAMVLFFRDYLKNQNKGGLLIAIGILISFSSAIIFVKKIALSQWFNHNDIGHIITLISLYLMYKGAVILKEKSIKTGVAV